MIVCGNCGATEDVDGAVLDGVIDECCCKRSECHSGGMDDFLRDLPKCEHHVHLEGTLEPSLLFTLAERNHTKLPEGFPKSITELEQKYLQFKDLQDFLDLYYVGMSVLQNEQDFQDLAFAYLAKAASQGAKHVECFFDPQGHTSRGVAFETVIIGFRKALLKAENELGISTKLIMCLLRHLPAADCMEPLKQAKTYYEQGWIHGLGLDSSENGFPPQLFIDCYAYARDNYPKGTLLTAHAGEEGTSQNVLDTLDLLKCTRIDHGIHSADDPKVLARLASEKTLLTVCPLSNLRLCVVDDVGKLPLRKFLDAGVHFSLNSDDPAYFGGYILDNYIAVQKAFNFDLSTWVQIAKNAVEGSICSTERKLELYYAIETVQIRYKHLDN